ncbi:MAG: tetratricopeptide repeat protein [Chloroflexi bacterium]|nr:tetratricopeptide repeat protein [Chloroflexota bacterium]
MNSFAERSKRDRIKQAVALAMNSRWEEAVAVNRSLLQDFPDDLESYNRLGKAYSELGRIREARDAFQKALELSPYNSIAKKNLDRLMRLGDDGASSEAQLSATVSTSPQAFIEESGKAGTTSLINLAPSKTLLKLSPGRSVQLNVEGNRLKVTNGNGEYVGQVEPRVATRLTKLISGGNRYEANVTSVGDHELTIIIREVFKHPSQAAIVSFPSRGGADYRVYLPSAVLDYDVADQETDEEPVSVKDWSDDDTEPGDDEAFTPVLHRIINADEVGVEDEEEF